MERPPRRRDEKILSFPFILRAYFVQGSLLALSCYATYYYMGWVLGAWQLGQSFSSMPASPRGLKFAQSTPAYLQTLTAYFFPTVTTQIANVLCKRSWKTSLFAANFLNPSYRREALDALAQWRPRRTPVNIWRFVLAPMMHWLAKFFERHFIVFNIVSNPLIDLGVLFELLLCYFFFYTPLADIYYFAAVPWHVYLFACHGTVILFAFEECKKYYRRKGYPLEFLG